jgi:hypothetical protein
MLLTLCQGNAKTIIKKNIQFLLFGEKSQNMLQKNQAISSTPLVESLPINKESVASAIQNCNIFIQKCE